MKHRRTRVPQTGAVNVRLNRDTVSTKSHCRIHSTTKLKAKDKVDNDWFMDVLPSNIKEDHPHKRPMDENSDPDMLLHNKSQGNILSRTCLYKDDIQNTKVIYFDSSKGHNIEKMKDIKQIIQRKYANRKKIYNIFAEWDQDHKGEISPQNAQVIMNSMGIEVDDQEAEQFVKYVSSEKNAITLNDFLGMLY